MYDGRRIKGVSVLLFIDSLQLAGADLCTATRETSERYVLCCKKHPGLFDPGGRHKCHYKESTAFISSSLYTRIAKGMLNAFESCFLM